MRILVLALASITVLTGCDTTSRETSDSTSSAVGNAVDADTLSLLVSDTLRPAVVTDTVVGDSDDPAIWVNPVNSAQSFVLGTDKGDSLGGVYAFRLDGRIDRTRSVQPLRRMNNVDVEYGMSIQNTSTDIAVATERNRMMIRVFALPTMSAIDGGGISVFDGDTTRAPMGIALYKRPRDGAIFAIVGGKGGPTDGTYLWQYQLTTNAQGTVIATKVRAFGAYSGTKEIEAIAVDDAFGYVYYSDEGVGVRKYHADPDSGNTELALFAKTGIADDHEGIAIFEKDSTTGYIVLSDQGAQRIHVFAREGRGGNPHDHQRLAIIPVMAQETDGLDVTHRSLGPTFPRGMLAMMSNRGAFHFYRWEDVEAAILRATGKR